MEKYMIELENLSDIQKSLCDILWELDDPDELHAFLNGLPERLRRDAESMVQMMLLNSIDKTEDTKYADEMLSKILKSGKPDV
jgi:predicted DNA-binding protein